MPLIPVSDFASRLDAQIAFLRTLVEMESPSTEKKAIDRLGELLSARLSGLGAEVRRLAQDSAGDHWLAEWGDGPPGILLLAHLDTVYPLGTLDRFPWRMEEGLLRGPGALDMKASLAMVVFAVDALRNAGGLPARRITLLATSDEEVGSHTSRPVIEEQARRHDLVLCLEPALPNGSLKTERKGVGIYRLRAEGRAAHAGSNPEQGINAILEMAHQVARIHALADPAAGTTLNVGVIQGGTRSNVIPETCTARLDLRVDTEAEAQRVDHDLRALQPVLPEAAFLVEGGLNRPPMPRTPAMAQAFERVKALGAELGIDLSEGKTGGGSDANFVAPLGVAVIDGLGAVGDGAHSEREHVRTASLPERTALLAAILSRW